MPTIILFVLFAVGLIIAVDTVRQRKIRATRTIDLRGLVTTRPADPRAPLRAPARQQDAGAPRPTALRGLVPTRAEDPAAPIGASALERALAEPPPVQADV